MAGVWEQSRRRDHLFDWVPAAPLPARGWFAVGARGTDLGKVRPEPNRSPGREPLMRVAFRPFRWRKWTDAVA